ncbi:MAG: SpoIIE family protein phosphatase, partial [Planctomycetes bacterium]|nr:SpoIIE family protein phosphatase [Planctomycetota bacterium]
MARHDSVSAELARARSVQEFMLPAAPTVPGLEIATSYRACKGLGGDFYDFLVVDPWHLGIVIADVSGHGTAAALVMSAAKKTLQIVGRNCHSPRDVLLLANDAIRADLPRGMFVSAWYGILDIRDLSLVFARAGHPPCLLVSDGAVRGQWPEGPGPVLGIMPSSQLGPRLAESRLQLRPGDAMLLHTDGLSEAFAPEGEMYGKTRLHQKLLRAPDVGAEQFITELRADVDRFRADEPPTDDEAMVLVRVLGRMGKPQPLGSGEDAEAPEFLDDLPPLLGRDRDIAELCDLIGGDAALVTITGPGGVGKTRAAQAVAARMKNHFPSGVWFVDLTSARETWAICRAVAGALGVQEGDSALNVRVGNALRGRAASRGGPALLVLDNCEQAAEPVGRLVNEWRARAPGTRFLLTSRVPVNTRGEHIYNLRPLRTPSRRTGRITVNEAVLKALAEIPSVDLFVRRARERSPRFALTAQNAETVCRICEALDGLPLAIELAAARVGVMTPDKFLERLGERFEWLRGREDTGHHATLEDLIGWSWDLLEPAERDLLAELSVFHGG